MKLNWKLLIFLLLNCLFYFLSCSDRKKIEPNLKEIQMKEKSDLYDSFKEAVEKGNLTLIKQIYKEDQNVLNYLYFSRNNFLFLAIEYRQVEVINFLLKKGIDINHVNEDNVDAFEYALQNRFWKGFSILVQFYLERGGNPDRIFIDETALSIAINHDLEELFEEVLSHKPNLKFITKEGKDYFQISLDKKTKEGESYILKLEEYRFNLISEIIKNIQNNNYKAALSLTFEHFNLNEYYKNDSYGNKESTLLEYIFYNITTPQGKEQFLKLLIERNINWEEHPGILEVLGG